MQDKSIVKLLQGWDMKAVSSSREKHRQTLVKAYREFAFIYLLFTLVPVLSIGAFNVLVNPYGLFNVVNITGINSVKPEKFNNDMLIKAVEVSRKQPNIIFLGTSRVQWGLNSNYSGLKTQETYNLALQGANMYELRCYFEHALINQPDLEQVVIGLDELMFSKFVEDRPDFNPDRLGKRHIDLQDSLNTIFSLDAFDDSRQTIQSNRENPQNVLLSNFMVKPDIFVDGTLALDSSRPTPGSVETFKANLANRLRPDRSDGRYSQYELSDESLEDFRKIVEISEQHNIDLKVFISPEHSTLFAAMNSVLYGPEIDHWKRELVKIAPVWDFSGYNSITTEALSRDMKYYLDSSHYSPETGNLILERMLMPNSKTVPADFGVLITPDNIESHLEKTRADYEKWAKNHSELAALIQ